MVLERPGSDPLFIATERSSQRLSLVGMLRDGMVLLTSGTTGVPKLVVHTLASLTGAIDTAEPRNGGVIEHVLRYSPLWRFADISARHADR